MESLMNVIATVVAILLILVVGKRFFWWYWGINDMLKNQKKQTLLLEKLVRGREIPMDLLVRERKTGIEKRISLDGWIDLDTQYPNQYEIVNHG